LSSAPDISLQPLGDDHLADMAALIADAEVRRFTRIPDELPDGFVRSWLERYKAGREDGTCAGFAVLDEQGRFAGLGLAPAIDSESGEVEIGYIVAAGARGRGVATEMLRRLTAWALDELGAQRLVLIIDVENVASSRVAARAGYSLEGVMRSIFVKAGVRRDAELWSRLPGDGGAESA
jgi:RimJ/RimL family protein N-acetyltransferase